LICEMYTTEGSQHHFFSIQIKFQIPGGLGT
jgi:hypothetical protein